MIRNRLKYSKPKSKKPFLGINRVRLRKGRGRFRIVMKSKRKLPWRERPTKYKVIKVYNMFTKIT